MSIDFQHNVLRFLFQYKTPHINYIHSEIFDLVEHKSLFELLKLYIAKYKAVPNQVNFLEFVRNQHGLSEDGLNLLLNTTFSFFEPLNDTAIIEQTILNEVKKKMFTNIIPVILKYQEAGLTIPNIEDIHKRISSILTIDTDPEESGLRLLRDINMMQFNTAKVYPTFIEGLNRMTSKGGFYSPQLITWLGPPKAFKTGLMIKFAAEYMKDGLNVVYADFENGQQIILDRFKQALLEVKITDIVDFNSELLQIKDKLLSLVGSGEVFIKKFAKRVDHVGSVKNAIIKEIEQGFEVPKLIIYDYIDIMGSPDKRITEPRRIIQENYAAATNLNDELGSFCFTVSKMKRDAINKEWPTVEDVAEDFEKIYNSHGVFAVSRNEDDIVDGLGRIIPIVQREGSSYTKSQVILTIDPENFIIKENFI